MRSLLTLGLTSLLVLSGCGGSDTLVGVSGSGNGSGSGAGSGQQIATAGPNVAPLTVEAGPANTVNLAFTTVTICAPKSTTNCQTIDHVEVDTGSYGLRVLSSVLSPSLGLPQETDNTGNAIVECTKFADGYSWGPIKVADIFVASEGAGNIPIQVIGDPLFQTVPSDCSSAGAAENTVASFGANAILGIGPFAEDCGTFCVDNVVSGAYYVCPSGGACQSTSIPLALQVVNPVVYFGTDNNGVILELPAVSSSGADRVAGALVFGIGTQGNNGLGSATVLSADPSSGYITTQYNGTSYPHGYIDSGSNAYFFVDNSIPICGSNTSANGFFCPSTTLNLSATNVATTGVTAPVSFRVANADSLFTSEPTFTAFDDLAAPHADPSGFDFGLPFFFGRNVYIAIERQNSSGGMGPYFAY